MGASLGLIQIVVLAVVQGITGLLPVSSSAHLILLRLFTGWPGPTLALEAAMHVGTLAAVLIYFWRDVGRMVVGLVRLGAGRRDRGALLAWHLILGTLPALAVGWAISRYAGDALGGLGLVAWAMVIFGVVLWGADRYGLTILRLDHLRASHVLLIGICQCLAFVPGIGRAGVAMLAGRLLSFERSEAARFSFLLAIPASAAVVLWEGLKLSQQGAAWTIRDAGLAAAVSAVVGFIAIAALMAWLRRRSFAPFVVWRLAVGGVLLAVVYL